MRSNKHILFVTAGLIFIITAFAASIPAEVKPPLFKNLKVLPKNISDEDLDKIMDNFNFALGVKCNFCHARKDTVSRHLDFPSDAKPEKEIARTMMRMTYDLNKKYFNFNNDKIVPQRITCIICHRKNSIPQTDTMPVIKRG